MDTLSRNEARTRKLTRFFTGKPCLHGHVAERCVDRNRCVVCVNEANQRSYQKKHSTENPHDPTTSMAVSKRMVHKIRGRAQKRDHEMTITYHDLLPLPTHCPILGCELIYRSQKQRANPAMASVDRIDSDLGYIPGNVRIISWRANSLRNNGTLEEMWAVVRDLEAHDAFPF